MVGPRVAERLGVELLDRKVPEDVARQTGLSENDAYGADGEDPSLYHLMLDSTALDLDTCVDLVVAASRARTRKAGTGRTDPEPGPPS